MARIKEYLSYIEVESTEDKYWKVFYKDHIVKIGIIASAIFLLISLIFSYWESAWFSLSHEGRSAGKHVVYYFEDYLVLNENLFKAYIEVFRELGALGLLVFLMEEANTRKNAIETKQSNERLSAFEQFEKNLKQEELNEKNKNLLESEFLSLIFFLKPFFYLNAAATPEHQYVALNENSSAMLRIQTIMEEDIDTSDKIGQFYNEPLLFNIDEIHHKLEKSLDLTRTLTFNHGNTKKADFLNATESIIEIWLSFLVEYDKYNNFAKLEVQKNLDRSGELPEALHLDFLSIDWKEQKKNCAKKALYKILELRLELDRLKILVFNEPRNPEIIIKPAWIEDLS